MGTPGELWVRTERDYRAQHRHPLNRRLHAIGVPIIVLSVLMALAVPRWEPWGVALDPGLGLLLFYGASYLIVAPRRAPLAIAWLLGCYGLARLAVAQLEVVLALRWAGGLFVLGWALQLIGHRIEGNRPAFLGNVLHLWAAPLALTGLARDGRLGQQPDDQS